MSKATDPANLFPGGWPQRLFFAWTTVVVPIACFAFVLSGLNLATWQAPGPGVWIQLLVDRPGAMGFAPLAAMVVLLCAAITIRPGAWVRRWYFRALILVGILFGLQYAVMLPAALYIDSPWPDLLGASNEWGMVLLVIVGVEVVSYLAVALFRFLQRRFGLARILVSLVLGIPTILFGVFLWNEGLEGLLYGTNLDKVLGLPAASLLAFLVFAGPQWAAKALIRLDHHLNTPEAPPLLGIVLGLVAYGASWRAALLLATEAYLVLPPKPPTCFIASAAAAAPPWLSGSFEVSTGGAGKMRVSPQLQRFKLFELALETLSLTAHRALRRVYDQVGPKIAARAQTPAKAALLWLALKPCEAFALLLQLLAGPAIRRRTQDLYR